MIDCLIGNEEDFEQVLAITRKAWMCTRPARWTGAFQENGRARREGLCHVAVVGTDAPRRQISNDQPTGQP